MGQAKPWQIILIAVAALVFAGSITMFLFGNKGVQLGTRIELVDLATGDLWWVDVSGDRRVTLPAKHPDTEQRSIVRVDEEDGVFSTSELGSAAGFIAAAGLDPKTYFKGVESFESGIVNPSDAPKRQYKPGG